MYIFILFLITRNKNNIFICGLILLITLNLIFNTIITLIHIQNPSVIVIHLHNKENKLVIQIVFII